MAKKQSAKYSMADYMTAQKAETPVRMYLTLPTGEPTDDYLLVVGTESARYRNAKFSFERRMMALAAIEDDKQRSEQLSYHRAEILAACVLGWSFDEEWSEEAALELIVGAPYIGDLVDKFISKRHNFFAKASTK
ncbi:hypothetical protein [Providencia phage Kokobel2]|nr:hypothetical protein [Providencia phage Kokobel2]